VVLAPFSSEIAAAALDLFLTEEGF